MIYSPVIITTLNRHEHFRQCLESLERCTDADKTNVYVALDYPPSEKMRRALRLLWLAQHLGAWSARAYGMLCFPFDMLPRVIKKFCKRS